jgi:hypothetical protein
LLPQFLRVQPSLEITKKNIYNDENCHGQFLMQNIMRVSTCTKIPKTLGHNT